MEIQNPILKGFNPDPSIIYNETGYYIATSTFEWFPGVQIHHSVDLVNWKLVARPLNSIKLLDMRGNRSSAGVWAPCLSYDNGLYYLVYTNVRTWAGPAYKDTHNYITTATDIAGPWSDPVYINSSGFDPSLFHDDDGRKWFVNMEWDYRQSSGDKQFTGILLQELDVKTGTLFGETKKIFTSTPIGLVEGPHLYKKDGYYYLMTAEGGTSYEHAITLARSEQIDGPYELHPQNPLLTSHQYDGLIQKAGHGSWCQGHDGHWYLAHLCGRPLAGTDRCVLGRETSLQQIVWKDNWPYLINGGNNPADKIEVSSNAKKEDNSKQEYTFHDESFWQDFQTLRIPYGSLANITERSGHLRLHGRESMVSEHEQIVVARRQTDFCFEAETQLEMYPKNYQEMAGLIYRYDERNQYYLKFSFDEKSGLNCLDILTFDRGGFSMLLGNTPVLIKENSIKLKICVNEQQAQFYYSIKNDVWHKIGGVLDASILSDDYVEPMGFTGAFIGMTANDMNQHKSYADFSYFTYTALTTT